MDEWERLADFIVALQMLLLEVEQEFREAGGNDEQLRLLKSYAEVKLAREIAKKLS